MRNIRITLFYIVAFGITVNAQVEKQIGQKLPDSPVEMLLQAPKKNIDSWEKLQGKWLLLEFWTTWCAPCIKKMPALNKLEKEMKGENIQFISISPEDPEKVKRFLKRKSISGWVGIDSDGSFLEALKITSYPKTLLINPKGEIHDVLKTSTLDKKTLMNAMNSEINTKKQEKQVKPNLTKKILTFAKGGDKEKKNKTKPVYYVEIDKTDEEGGFTMSGKLQGKFLSSSIPLSKLIASVFEISPFLLSGDQEMLDQKYKVRVSLPSKDIKMFNRIVQEAIAKKVHIKFEKKVQEITSYELTLAGKKTKNLIVNQTQGDRQESRASNDDGIIAVSNRKIGTLVKMLEQELKTQITDNTALSEKYDYNLYWDAEKPESIIKALKDQLGLVLKKRIVEKEVIVITKKKPKKKAKIKTSLSN